MWSPDEIASLCYNHFIKLPKRGKPEAGREWTLLAAVILLADRSEQDTGQKHSTQHDDMKTDKCSFKQFAHSSQAVVSLGTGTKCIGQSAMSLKGKCQRHFAQMQS